MNIQQIKAAIAAVTGFPLPILQFTTQLDEKKEPTEWVSHWDNINRVRITMHADVLNTIKADQSFDGLAYKHEVVQPEDQEKSPYIRFILITPKNIVGTF